MNIAVGALSYLGSGDVSLIKSISLPIACCSGINMKIVNNSFWIDVRSRP